MRSYTRSRKLLGAARPRVFHSLLLSMLMLTALLVRLSPPGEAQQTSAAESEATLFQNVRIFDGKSSTLSTPSSVLVRGDKIERISTSAIAVDAGMRVIDCGGRTLMPGLIDMHWHAMLIRPTPAKAIFGDVGYNNLTAGDEAKDTLMRGFTTVRDVGGPVFGLKRAIDYGTRRWTTYIPLGRDDHRDQRPWGFSPIDRGEFSRRTATWGRYAAAGLEFYR